MADPTIVSIVGTIAPINITGTIKPVSVSVNINEYGWYAGPKLYLDFSQVPDYQITDFPDLPMDSPIILHEVTSAIKDKNSYGGWEE